MFDDLNQFGKDVSAKEPTGTPATSPENTVDLFPALADRKMMPINSIRQPVATKPGTQFSVFEPISFDEALDIVECLRARAATTITLDKMKKMDAKRLVDFVAGASTALSGNFHQLSEQVYVFCPSNIKISVPTQFGSKANAPSGPGGLPSLDFLYPADSQHMKTRLSSNWATV